MTFFEHFIASFHESQAFRAEQIAQGTLSEIPLLNWKFCLLMNIFYFVTLKFLFKFMEKREGYKLRTFMIFYNISCVILASTCLYGGIVYYYFKSHAGLYCNNLDYNSPNTKAVIFYYCVFHFQKYWEFLDTFIFILRKSYRQVTFLHVYHHSSITLVTLLVSMYLPAGDNTIAMVLNSFVHVLMYSHYLCAVLKIKVWWRQILTKLQLIQFVIILGVNFMDLVKGCSNPFWVCTGMIGYMITMLILFGNFYIQRYLQPAEEKPKAM
ncbi:hypothetical protein WA158_004189 [Blastocystis sp. Blastoise]